MRNSGPEVRRISYLKSGYNYSKNVTLSTSLLFYTYYYKLLF